MERREYVTKKGLTLYRPNLSQEEAEEIMMDGDLNGWCLACGTEQYGVEPDAQHYICESCGQPKVYGIEQLILMGIALVEGEVAL